MSHVPSPEVIETVALHLPIWPMSARAIWQRQRDRLWTPRTFKRALDHLTANGKAERVTDTMPNGTPRSLYRRCEGRAG